MTKTVKDRLVYVGTILFYGAIAYGVYRYSRTPVPAVVTHSPQTSQSVSNHDEVLVKTQSDSIKVRINPILGEKK